MKKDTLRKIVLYPVHIYNHNIKNIQDSELRDILFGKSFLYSIHIYNHNTKNMQVISRFYIQFTYKIITSKICEVLKRYNLRITANINLLDSLYSRSSIGLSVYSIRKRRNCFMYILHEYHFLASFFN